MAERQGQLMVEMVQAALREVDLSPEQASAFKAALVVRRVSSLLRPDAPPQGSAPLASPFLKDALDFMLARVRRRASASRSSQSRSTRASTMSASLTQTRSNFTNESSSITSKTSASSCLRMRTRSGAARKGDGFLVESNVRNIERNLSQRLDGARLGPGRPRARAVTESARPRRWAVPQNHDLHRQRQEGTGPPGTGSGGIFGGSDPT